MIRRGATNDNGNRSDMKKTLLALVLLSAVPAAAAEAAAGVLPSRPETAPDPLLREDSFYDVWIRDRLTVGLAVSWNKLTDADRPRDLTRTKTFLGFINRLELENEIGWTPVVSWLASDYVRLGLSWQRVEARTWNFPRPPYTESHTDGIASSSGPAFSVEGCYPTEDGVWRPHAGVEIGFFRGGFDADNGWWRYGYPSKAEWEASGRSKSPSDGRNYRYIDVDDAIGWSLSAGIACRPHPRLELDLSIRQTWLEPDCEFGYENARNGRRAKERGGEFTFDSFSVAFSASYVF